MKIFSQQCKSDMFEYGKHYTIIEKSCRIHTFKKRFKRWEYRALARFPTGKMLPVVLRLVIRLPVQPARIGRMGLKIASGERWRVRQPGSQRRSTITT